MARHTPVRPPGIVGRVGTSAWTSLGGATDHMSQFRWHHMRRRRILLRRPAGLSFTVDDPTRRSHHPRAYAPSCQQRYEVKIDGPMQFAFANPLRLPTSGHRITAIRRARRVRGLPTLRQATCRTLRRPEVRTRLGASDSDAISFVSYFSFASKRLAPQRSIAIWSRSPYYDTKLVEI